MKRIFFIETPADLSKEQILQQRPTEEKQNVKMLRADSFGSPS